MNAKIFGLRGHKCLIETTVKVDKSRTVQRSIQRLVKPSLSEFRIVRPETGVARLLMEQLLKARRAEPVFAEVSRQRQKNAVVIFGTEIANRPAQKIRFPGYETPHAIRHRQNPHP